MIKFITLSTVIASFNTPTDARLAVVKNDFQAQVTKMLQESPPTDCERGPGSTMFCDENEFCKLVKAHRCPSTKYRRFVGTCVPAGDIICPAIWDPVW